MIKPLSNNSAFVIRPVPEEDELLTADDIARIVRRSRFRVKARLDKNGLQHGWMSSASGRLVATYRRSALRLWLTEEQYLSYISAPPSAGRKRRADHSKPRSGRNPETVQALTNIAFAEFLSNAVKDARQACRRALRAYAEQFGLEAVEPYAKAEWLYKNHVCRSDKHFKGPFYTQGWEQKHTAKWRKLETAMSQGTVRYNFWRIAENSLGCGPGRGYARFIMLDDRKGDAWTTDENGRNSMRYAVYAWCVLTGALLWVEPAEKITANTYIRAIISAIYAHGLDCPVFFLENSSSALAAEVCGVVQSLYTEQDKAVLKSREYAELFKGTAGVYRNVPHIPRDLGKAVGERLFGEIKRSDSLVHPHSYQGGSLREAVQLARKNVPVLGKNTPSVASYFDSVWDYAYSEHLEIPRDSLKEWAKEKGLEPTREAMVRYYAPEQKSYPTAAQAASLLYYCLPVTSVKLSTGQLRVTLKGRQYNLRAPELYTYELQGRKLDVIQSPFDDSQFLVFERAQGALLPKYICTAQDFTISSADDLHLRHESRRMREENIARMQAESEEAARAAEELIRQRKLSAGNLVKFQRPAAVLPPAETEIDVVVDLTQGANIDVTQFTQQADHEAASDTDIDPSWL